MFTKSMAWFFFLVSIINIPILYFYWKGQPDPNGLSPTRGNIFSRFSLGNIGQDTLTCGQKISDDPLGFTINLSCPSGNISSLVGFGYANTSNDTCNAILPYQTDDVAEHFTDDCYDDVGVQDVTALPSSKKDKTAILWNDYETNWKSNHTTHEGLLFDLYQSKTERGI